MNTKQLREVAKAAALNADWDSYEEVFHPLAVLRLLDVVEAAQKAMIVFGKENSELHACKNLASALKALEG